MGKPDAPDPPNYAAAATAQGVANEAAARLTARMNRPDEFNPLGSRTWQDLGGDRMKSTTALTPAGTNLFNQQMRISTGLGNVSENALGRVSSEFAKPFAANFDRDAYADALMKRYDTQFGRDEESTRSRMLAAGMGPGTEAYQREFERMDQARNDAELQAYLNAGKEQGADIERQSFLRNVPLNELNALRTGAQPSMPSFQAYGGGGQVQPAPVMQGAQQQYQGALDQYNAQAGQQGNLMTGLFGLGSAALGNPWMFA